MASQAAGCTAPDDALSAGDDNSAHALAAPFRIGFLVKVGVTVICAAAVAGAVVYAVLAEDLGTYAQSFVVINRVQKLVVGTSVLSALIQIVLIGAPITALVLFASHKIAGPLVRLTGCFRRAREGVLPAPVCFRTGDQVGRVEARFNDVSRAIAARHDEVKRRLARLRAAEEELAACVEAPADRDSRLAAARRVQECAGELEQWITAVTRRATD